MLVGRGAGVEDVLGQLFAFVLHGVEEQAVGLFKHRQHRFTRHAGPATKHRRHFVLRDQLFGFFCEQRPVGGGVHHHRLKLLAEQAAFGVDFINGHQGHVLEHRFGNGHGARERMQHTHLDGGLGMRQTRNRERGRGQSDGTQGMGKATTRRFHA